MDNKKRHERLRLLVKKLNRERKQQARKTDILCNDFVAAQREFIRKLNTISFTAAFYEAILGAGDLNDLLYTAAALVKDEIPESNVTFFLRQPDGFELHMFENNQPISLDEQHIENCFTAELMESICKSNKVCMLEEMFAMGLEGNLADLTRISGATVPLGVNGDSVGFMLIYRPSRNKLTRQTLTGICAATCGLSRAIRSCRAPSRPAS